MNIRKINREDLRKLINFNLVTYKKRDKVEESINYRFLINPFNKNSELEIFIAEDENKNIVGQVLMMPSEFMYFGKKYPCFWAMDYFVDETSRGISGVILAKKAIDVKHHFTMGLTNIALGVHLALGEKIVGNLTKYIKLNSVSSLYRFMFISKKRETISLNFPEYLNAKEGKFIRVYKPEDIISLNDYWNADLLEFTRSQEFINWRFFYFPDKYFIYKYTSEFESKDLPCYFIVRPLHWRGAKCLLLVDYRFSTVRSDMFGEILKSVALLSRKLNMAATFTGSSLPGCDAILKRNLFIKYGDKLKIVTKFQPIKENTNIGKDVIMVTYADSDNDFCFGSTYL